ncbi:MAG: PhzF family phenazine biosynthesis protein [Anaerolineae bacterium]|nr:PhzF family phenazine biosynthesis protein [Anaerolineae bacterium]
MKKLHYHLVDVFTDRPFGGNQLAVFSDGWGLSPQVMQQLAKEINFSETTFVLPPQDPGNDFWVRIFTPAVEMPIAGHPTVGTAFVLGREKLIDQTGPETMIHFEEGVGVIPVRVQWQNGQPGLIRMSQPLPEFGPEFPDRKLIAEMLSLEPDELDPDFPLQVVSCGLPFLYVPLKNLAAIRRARLRLDLWEKQLKDFASPHLFLLTAETELKNSTVHCRMFAPALGIVEDPATGAASGPLGCYLVKYDRRPPTHSTGSGRAADRHKKQMSFISEQGFEMGRPSLIHIEIEQENDQITAVTVGGQCVFMGEGYFELSES